MSEKSRMSSVWEKKRKLAEKRLMNLTRDSDDNVESVVEGTPLLRLPPRETPTSVGVSSSARGRAEEVRDNLSLACPSFLKEMLKSHVSGGFWLGLPRRFCLAHLPDQDEMVVLVDENGEEYNTKYLSDKNGISGGWRGFSTAHNLHEGDVLVFHLIEPCKFKVYIVRAETGVMNFLNLDSQTDPINEVRLEEDVLELVHAESDVKEDDTRGLDFLSETAADLPEENTDHSCSEIMDVIRFSESALNFRDVKSFEDFHVHVDGLMIDAEIPTHIRKKYHDLCCSQNTFLHENLMQGLNTKLAAGMICETTNIADAIRAAKPSTGGTHHLQSWVKTLGAFEDLGMVVGFLLARINKLLSLSDKVQAEIDLKSRERDEAEEEMRSLRMKLSGVKKRIANLGDEIDGLAKKKEELGSIFAEVAAASW